MDLDLYEFHVHVAGFPLRGMNRQMAQAIGRILGTFVDWDEGAQKGLPVTTMRLKVLLNVTKPLFRVITIEGPNKQPIRLSVMYEKLPNFCYYCGVMGHLISDCTECIHLFEKSDVVDESKLPFGDWLRARLNSQNDKVIVGSLRWNRETGPADRRRGILGKLPSHVQTREPSQNNGNWNNLRDLRKTVTESSNQGDINGFSTFSECSSVMVTPKSKALIIHGNSQPHSPIDHTTRPIFPDQTKPKFSHLKPITTTLHPTTQKT